MCKITEALNTMCCSKNYNIYSESTEVEVLSNRKWRCSSKLQVLEIVLKYFTVVNVLGYFPAVCLGFRIQSS